MQRRYPVLLMLVGAVALAILTLIFIFVQPTDDGTPADGALGERDREREHRTSGSVPDDFEDTDRVVRRESQPGRADSERPRRDEPAVAAQEEAVPDAAAGGGGHTATILSASADLPMATKGRSLGIDTALDDDWVAESEAAQWFEPVHDAFEATRPLTPDGFHEVLGGHRETTVDVLKRAGEIAEQLGPEEGMAFLDEWNTLVDDFRREAYGRPPRD